MITSTKARKHTVTDPPTYIIYMFLFYKKEKKEEKKFFFSRCPLFLPWQLHTFSLFTTPSSKIPDFRAKRLFILFPPSINLTFVKKRSMTFSLSLPTITPFYGQSSSRQATLCSLQFHFYRSLQKHKKYPIPIVMSLICYKPFNVNEIVQLEKEKKEKGKYLS